MKRTSASLIGLSILALFVFAVLIFQPSRAQTRSAPPAPPASQLDGLKQIPKLVRNVKAAGAVFAQRKLIQAEDRLFQANRRLIQNQERLAAVLNDGVVFDVDKSAVSGLLKDRVDFLTLSFPDGRGARAELELVKVDIFAPGFSVKTAAPASEQLDANSGVHYRGIVKGNDQSLAAISIFGNEVSGFFSTPANGNSVIGRLAGDNPSGTHIVYAENNLTVDAEFSCNTPDLAELPSNALLETPQELPGNCVRIYVEVDFDIVQSKGNATNAANYVTAVFNQSATLFANDGIPISLSEMLVWNVQSPYAGLTNTGALLGKFQQTRTSFNGDFGHLVATRGNGGLAASINGFCSTVAARECYSGIDIFYFDVPTFSWTVYVFTHELGHLMGSFHTHACIWNGNNTAIDGCGPAVGRVEGSCSAGPIPADGGTIMSYCHLTSARVNFNLGFGPQPRNLIINKLNDATCLTNCGAFTIGQNAPDPQLFIDAANRNNFLQFAKQPPLNAVHRWDCFVCDPNNPTWGKGLIQDFDDVTPEVHDALMLADTNTSFVAQIYGGMWDKFVQLGGLEYNSANTRMIGYPVADRNCSDFNAACFTDDQLVSSAGTSYHYQRFQGAAFVMHRSGTKSGQTFEVHGAIRARWQALNGPDGSFGLPVSDEYAFNSKRRSDFEGGSICFNPATNQTEDNCQIQPRPAAQPATNVANTSFTANWDSSTGATGYRLDVSTTNTFSSFVSDFQNVDVRNVLSHTVFGLAPGTTYFYRVRAYNNIDTSDNSGSIQVTTTNATIQVTVQTNPAGRSFSVDGVQFTSSQTFTWSAGTGHTLSTTTPQEDSAGVRYEFSDWSNGGPLTHGVSPTSDVTYTANFTRLNAINVALPANGGVASASSTFSHNYPASNAINGERAGANSTTGGVFNGWIGSTATMPQWVQVDFGQVRNIHEVGVFTVQDNYPNPSPPTQDMTFSLYGLQGYQVQYWDGSAWLAITGATVTGNNKVWKRLTFPTVTTSKIRVLTSASPDSYSRITEIEAWSNSAAPPPSALNVALTANGGVASASSTFSIHYPASTAINGERAGGNSTTGGVFNGWIGSSATMPQWVQVDFGQVRNIHEVDVFTVQDNYPNPAPPAQDLTFSLYGLQGYEVQYWNGSSWVAIPGGTVSGNNQVWKQFTFPAIATSKIRVLTASSPDSYSRVTEVEAWANVAPPPQINVALPAHGGVASASSTFSIHYPASTAINGERAGGNSTTGGVFNGWIGSSATMPQWLQVDFGQVRNIHEVDVFTVQDNYPNPAPPAQDLTFSLYGLQGYEVQYWNGSSWVAIPGGTVNGNNKVWKQFTFSAIATSKIRVLTASSPDSYSRVTEIEAWSSTGP